MNASPLQRMPGGRNPVRRAGARSALLLLAIAAAHPADDCERLLPWASLDGKPHPDEALVPTADWTTRARTALAPRLVQTLARDWTFDYLPAERLDLALLGTAADDARWPVVALPHTWHTFETTREVHPFIARPSERDARYWWNGWGIYRKRFSLKADDLAHRRVSIEFGAVMKYCRVWLNGQEVGDHKGGYASFSFDLTRHLRDGDNLLAVAVSARRDDEFRTPPMTAGNFDVYGGIYRDVRLVSTSLVHIPFQGSATHEGGTFVTTPEVGAERAVVRVRTWVQNDDAQERAVTLRTTIRDPAGREVAVVPASAAVAAGALREFAATMTLPDPQLWSIGKPVLYRVESEVLVGDEVVDRYASPLGIRSFAWNRTENRAYLNGQRLELHGTNRHQEFPWLGDAVPAWIHVRDMADMRFGLGHDFLRTAHYTQDALVYDLADRYGMLVCEEVPNIKTIEFDDDVQKQQVIEMVRRDRNHPSIVMWSVGNETSDPADSAWVHAEDDTRLIHERRSNLKKAGAFITHTDKNMDMENLLRCTVRGWTHRDVADFEPANGQQTGTEEWQHAQAMVEGGSQRGRIDMPNGNVWIYADHGADREYLDCPLLHVNPKGWTDIYRIPKYMYRLWQANYASDLMVFAHPEYWQARYAGQRHDVIVDSNGETVELLVDGRSLGTQRPGPASFWNVTFKDVPVERGELRVRATRDGKTVTRCVAMAGAPQRLTLAASHPALEAATSSIAVVTVDAVDAQGIPVPEFSRDLRWSVAGPATLVTPDTYTSDLRKNQELNGTFYIVAPVCALIRCTGAAGDIVVSVAAEGIAPASVTIRALMAAPHPGFVAEPPLDAAGRRPVAVAPAGATAARPGKPGAGAKPPAATAMRMADQDIVLPAGRASESYQEELRGWFGKHDPAAMARPVAFAEIVGAFAAHLVANGGLLVADDFNQRALQFNDAIALEDGILARRLPDAFALPLRRWYAHRLIGEGRPLRIADELRWIAALPGDAKVETLQRAETADGIFTRWYPDAARLDPARRRAALARFQRINQAAAVPGAEDANRTADYPAAAALLRPTLDQLMDGK